MRFASFWPSVIRAACALGIVLAGCLTAVGQSVSFPNPGAVSGSAVRLPCTVTSITSLANIEWQIDGERQLIVPAVQGDVCPIGTWNSYYASNGSQHTMIARAFDAKNNVLATSSSAIFSVENSLPQQTTPTTDITVANGPAPVMTLGSCPGGCANPGTEAIALKTTGTSTVTQAAAPISNTTGAGATLSTGTFSDSVGQALVVFTTWDSGTMTVSNVGGDSWSCANSQAASSGFIGQWCYALNIHGSASEHITVTYSSSQTACCQSLFAYVATNVATSSALDAQANTNAAYQSNPLIVTQGSDLVFYGLSQLGFPYSINASAGYTASAPASNIFSAVEYAQMPSSGWLGQWGFNSTVNGPLASNSSKVVSLFVDGQMVMNTGSGSSANPLTVFVATNNYANGSHQVLLREDGPNCSGCVNGFWTDMGGWEQTITFANPVVPRSLRLSAREAFMCVSASGTCHYPTSYTLTGFYENTDGSTMNTTISCGAPSSSAVTASGCAVTAVSNGIAWLTATATNGMTRTMYLMVEPQDGLPHFSKSGAILTAFSPANSMLRTSQFFSGGILYGYGNQYPNPQAANDYRGAGFTTVEQGLGVSPPSIGVSQSTFQANVNNEVSNVCGEAATYSLKVHLIGDSWARGSGELGTTMLGPGNLGSPIGSTYTTPAWQYYMTQYLTCAIGIDMVDEVTSSWGGQPLQAASAPLSPGQSGLTSISVSGTTGTVTCSTCSLNGSNHFIITGDTGPCASVLNYNPATNANNFQASSESGNFTFTTASSCTGSASSSAVLHPYANYTLDSTLNACPPGGSSAGPCPNYIPDNSFYTIRGWHLAAGTSGGPLMTWPPRSGLSGIVVQQWCGKATGGSPARSLADFCTFYQTAALPNYHPMFMPLSDLQQENLNTIRTSYYPNLDFAKALVSETNGTPEAYSLSGYPVTVTSCSGDTITFSSDHGLRNRIPADTRLSIIGSSGGNCDGNFYVWAIPDSTHIRVWRQSFTLTASATTGTITWQDGSTTSISSLVFMNATSGSTGQLAPNAINLENKRNMTFTVSGSSTGFDGLTFAFDMDVNDHQANGQGVNGCPIHQMANFSASTGGRAYILPNNSYVRGPQNFSNNSDEGPRHLFASQTTPYLLRVSGTRQYASSFGLVIHPDFYDRASSNCCVFTSANYMGVFEPPGSPIDLGGVSGGVQAQINPHWDYANTFVSWDATANATLLMSFLANSGFLLQPSLNSPDVGSFFEAAARTSIVNGVSPQYGNLLMIQSYADNALTCTANLAPYLIIGQPIYRYYATWSGISFATLPAGTTSDSMICEPGAFRAYIFPQANQFTPQQPAISVSMADVPGATDLLIQYAYSPVSFQSSVLAQSLLNSYDCGGTGSCTLPVDRNVGPLYYRLVYLGTNSKVVAVSDVQVL